MNFFFSLLGAECDTIPSHGSCVSVFGLMVLLVLFFVFLRRLGRMCYAIVPRTGSTLFPLFFCFY